MRKRSYAKPLPCAVIFLQNRFRSQKRCSCQVPATGKASLTRIFVPGSGECAGALPEKLSFDMVCQHRHSTAHARMPVRGARGSQTRVRALQRAHRAAVNGRVRCRHFHASGPPDALWDGSRLARLGWTPVPCAPSPWRGHPCSTTARLPRPARPPRPRRPRPPGTQLPRCGAAHPSAAQRADRSAASAARHRRRGRCRRRLGRRRAHSTQAAESQQSTLGEGSAGKAARPCAPLRLRILPGPARRR